MNTVATNMHIKPMAGAAGVRVEVTSGAAVALATSLTSARAPVGTRYVVGQVQAGALYMTFDGTTPSATNGILYSAGTTVEWSIATAVAAKAIAASTTGYVMLQGFTD